MCGIAGIVGLSPVNADAVQAMTDLMVHRGPDGEGRWLSADGRICFGHRRLSIIDLSERAAQPMQDAERVLTLTYNGEIYNYREIRRELEQAGHRFRTDSDTEVVIEAYRKWGEDCLDRFNGMFAFALHDASRKAVFCARDRFGEKPFLFAAEIGFFAFASEYKALTALDGVRTKIDDHMLMRFFVNPADGLDQQRNTLFRGIAQLLPGEKLVLDTETLDVRISSYWQPPRHDGDSPVSEDDAVAQFGDLLKDAVDIRLRSDVPVGSCLSGGLDSSAITCLARGLIGADASYRVFTGRFPGSDADEGYWADMVAEHAGAESFEAFPTGAKLTGSLDEFLWMNELPVDSTSQFAQWSVFQRAKEAGVTVLLDGQGSDEILGGYEQYFVPYMVSRRESRDAAPGEEAEIRARYPLAFSQKDQGWKSRPPLFARRFLSRALGRGTSPVFAMTTGMAGAADGAAATRNAPENLHNTLRRDSFNGFLTTLLRYGDRNSMAHSREVRLPFCDHRIAEFVATVPAGYLMGHAQTKYLLRRSMQGILPEPVVTRWRKQGFLPPVAGWLQTDLKEFAAEMFGSTDFADSPHWDAGWCRRALRRFADGETALAPTLWKVLVSESWRRRTLPRLTGGPQIAPLR